MHTKAAQQETLLELLKKARNTEIGLKYDFSSISTYEEFSNCVPVHSYLQIKDDIKKLKGGAEDLFWPGVVQRFAVSAGTSGEGKHLPLTDERLQSDKQFMYKVIKAYLKQRPNIFDLLGKHLSMPGSVEENDELQIGEISGFSALDAPVWLRIFQIVDPQKLTELSFQKKFNLLVEKALDADLKVITAVPSWILTLFQKVLEKTGKDTIADVWPNLKLLVCGGVKLANYRTHLEELAHGLSLDFIETYGASEGYIGYNDDLQKPDLKMVTDNGIFFECIPHPLPNTDASSIQETVPLWEIKTGVPYGLLMTTNAGLWRYTLNDVVEFTAIDPLRFVVRGRVNDMLDEFGEALYLYEAENALKYSAEKLEIKTGNFSISPILQSRNEVPHHRWFVQFFEPTHTETLQKIAVLIDEQLQQINRHYAIRRESNALAEPELKSINQADINTWMERHGKANAQGKLPKILKKNVNTLLD